MSINRMSVCSFILSIHVAYCTGRSISRSFGRSVVRSFGLSVCLSVCLPVCLSVWSFGRSVGRSIGRSFGRSVVTISKTAMVHCHIAASSLGRSKCFSHPSQPPPSYKQGQFISNSTSRKVSTKLYLLREYYSFICLWYSS